MSAFTDSCVDGFSVTFAMPAPDSCSWKLPVLVLGKVT